MRSYASLDALYAEINDLPRRLEVSNLRESAAFVYSARHGDVAAGNLEKKMRQNVSNTMILHDMDRGYLQDSVSDLSHDPYIFYHWNMIDSFVCYSQSLITLPPYCLITAAHNHGVKILGTLRTEGLPGKRVCEAFLASDIERNKFLESLARLAKFYKFDGWLFMIGNDLKATMIEDMIRLVHDLTTYIHTDIPGSEIIWYDTVSTLNAQRCTASLLNSYNEKFFENCDGIVLDFRYINSFLTNRAALGYRNGRPQAVYIGLDVAGKRCPGGGGFNLAHALDKVRQQTLSVAITNPSWTYKNFGPEKFLKIENIFWAQLVPHLYFRVPIYKNQSFTTSFCRGYGTKNYREGKVQAPGIPFCNLMWQKPQILAPGLHLGFTCMDIPKSTEDGVQKFETPFEKITVNESNITFVAKDPAPAIDYTEICNDYAWEGGSSLELIFSTTTQYHRLFLLQLESNQPLEATLVYRIRNTDEWQNDQSIQYPKIVLGHAAGKAIMSPSMTYDFNSDWRKSVYETNLKEIHEIGVLLGVIGKIRLGELVIQPIGAHPGLPRPVTVLSTHG